MSFKHLREPVSPAPLRRGWLMSAAIPLALTMLAPMPAAAQAEVRLERLETQLRALQRAVFPGGDQRFFEPEITPQGEVASPTGTGTTTSALTDMLARLDALEAQLARLTAASEVNGNALSSLETRLLALESMAATAGAPPAAALPAPVRTPPPTPATTPIATPTPAAIAAPTPAAAPTAAASGPSAVRLAAVRAILKPDTGDAGEDEYTYGFRLWDGGFYPEAQQQLGLFLQRYPTHRRLSFGRNLLGRAFLDAGDPRGAATHFLENYQSDKQGDRAADSLLYLAEAMIQLNDTRRACIALAEFGETYAALATGRLKGQYDTLSGRVECD